MKPTCVLFVASKQSTTKQRNVIDCVYAIGSARALALVQSLASGVCAALLAYATLRFLFLPSFLAVVSCVDQ